MFGQQQTVYLQVSIAQAAVALMAGQGCIDNDVQKCKMQAPLFHLTASDTKLVETTQAKLVM